MPLLQSPATEPPRRFTKDQERARRAYERAAAVTNDRRKDYKIAVVAFGANILRSGLSAALADLIRRKACGVLDDIVRFDIPGLEPVSNGDPLFMRVNNLAVGEYMLVTREVLQVAMWLKRACEVLFEDAPDSSPDTSPAVAHGGGDRAQ